jgi:hypothetical protein
LKQPKQLGRQNAFPEDSETDTLAWIQHETEKSQPSTRTNILHDCSGEFGKAVIREWVDSFLIRHKDEMAETISRLQADGRLQVPQEFVLGTINGIEEAVHGCTRDLVFNLDEVGVSEWEDRKSKKVVVPLAMSSQIIHREVNRNLKHITVITCIATSGEHVIPYAITSQESDDLRKALRNKGIKFGQRLILKKNQKAYINSKSFAEYIKSTFIPHITRIHAARGIEQEDAVLLTNNCPSHLTSDVMDLLDTAKVRTVGFAPYTT